MSPLLAQAIAHARGGVKGVAANAKAAYMAGMAYLLLKTLHVYTLALFAGSLPVVAMLASMAERQGDAGMLAAAWRLNRFVVTPAFIVAFFAGIGLAWSGVWYTQPWLIAKFAIVMAMGGAHGSFSGRLRRRATGKLGMEAAGSRFFAGMAAAFLLFLAAIVPLAVIKPELW